jgi:hypothetical protein
MGIWRYVNRATCRHNQFPLEDYPCREYGKHQQTFSEWEPKYSYDEMLCNKEG